MNGGSISGNSSQAGGGVYINSGIFVKTGGTITGYASDTINGNVARDGYGNLQNNMGHAVFIEGGIVLHKETTAGQSVNLSYNGKSYPVTFSGAWDN